MPQYLWHCCTVIQATVVQVQSNSDLWSFIRYCCNYFDESTGCPGAVSKAQRRPVGQSPFINRQGQAQTHSCPLTAVRQHTLRGNISGRRKHICDVSDMNHRDTMKCTYSLAKNTQYAIKLQFQLKIILKY